MLEPQILLLGPPKCGKTAFLMQFAHNHWQDEPIPVEIDDVWRKCPAYGGAVWCLSLWDFALSEEDLSPKEEQIKDASAYILFYNLCSTESFQIMQRQALQLVHYYNAKNQELPPIIIVATHLDKADTSREVSNAEGRTWTDWFSPKCKFFEVSSKVHQDTQDTMHGLMDLYLDKVGLLQTKKERCVIQ